MCIVVLADLTSKPGNIVFFSWWLMKFECFNGQSGFILGLLNEMLQFFQESCLKARSHGCTSYDQDVLCKGFSHIYWTLKSVDQHYKPSTKL